MRSASRPRRGLRSHVLGRFRWGFEVLGSFKSWNLLSEVDLRFEAALKDDEKKVGQAWAS